MLATMIVKWTLQLLLLVVILGNIQEIYAQECYVRDEVGAGRPCERACRSDGTCRKQNRECECDGRCGASCLKKKCPSIPPILNGSSSVDPMTRTIDAIATYTCNHGYSLVGNATRTCLSHKQWSGNPPVCERSTEVHCGILNTPANGQVTYDSETRTVGTVATYQCNAGYTNVAGDQERTCEQNGLWSGLPVSCSQDEACVRNEEEIARQNRDCMKTCTSHNDCLRNRPCVCDGACGLSCIPTERENYCPALPIRGHNFTLTILPESRNFGSIATYECRRNYERVRGDEVRTCLGNGDWSGSPALCLPKDRCGPPPEVSNARPSDNREFYQGNDFVSYSCDPGYYRVGGIRPVLNCHRGNWTHPDFTCRRKSCGDPGFLLNGRRIGTSFLFLDSVRFECNLGYRLVGRDVTHCQTDQDWSHPPPICQVVRCPSVQNPFNGQKIGYDYSYDSEVAFRCNLGYILEGANEIRCLTTGSWSAAPPTCREIRCPAPDVRSNVRSDQSLPEYPYQGTMRFYCENKFELRGPNDITCESNEQWSSIPPICVATCVVPTRPYYGRWLDNVRDGDTKSDGYGLTYTCNSGYFKCQISPLTCIDGEWIPPPQTLCPLGCLIQVTQDAGISVNYSHPDGLSCTNIRYKPVRTIRSFTCRRGYRIPEGAPGQSTCRSNERLRGQSWSSPTPTCEKILCPPIAIQNGRVRYTLNARIILTLEQNTTATFTCNNGYYKSHHNSSSCDLGIWTNEPPRCIEEPCSESSIDFGYWEAVYNTPESEPGSGYRLGGTIATFNCLQYGYATDVQQTCRLGSWDGQRPFCRKIPCEGENLNNGRVEYSSDRVEHGAIRSYICDDGFTLRGNDASTCDAGQWTRELPECVEDPCSENELDGNGWDLRYHPHAQDRYFKSPGTIATLECPHGYENSGQKICQRGSWRGNRLSCNKIPCPEEEIQHGRVDYRPLRPEHGSVRIFTCEEGYHQRQPVAESRCNAGVWSTNVPVCTEEPCSEDNIGVGQWRAEYNRDSVERGTRPHGTTATFVCTERGHRTSDTKQCLTGQWRGDEPTCTKIPCVHRNIRNGRVLYSTVNPEQGTTRNVACNVGYRATEIQDSVCDLGSWTTALPECIEMSCNKMDLQSREWNIDVSIEEGNNEDIMHLPGTVAIVTCNEFGFLDTPTRGGRKTCSLGEWQGFELLCERVSCSKEQFSNGRFVYYDHNNQRTTNPEHGSRLEAVCESGTHFIDGEVLHASRCLNGQWEQEVPACIGDPCLPLVNLPDNLAVTYSEESDGSHYPHSTLATFHCEEGFVLDNVDEEQHTCIKGTWRGPSTYPRCTIVSCPEEELQHGRVEYRPSRPEHGSVRIFTCEEGYHQRQPVAESRCNAGVWSTNVPVCTEDPCSVNDIGVGQWRAEYNRDSVERGTRPHGTTATFVCTERGHRTSDTKQCLTGQWRGDAPTCTKIPCVHQNIRNGSVLYSTVNPEQGTTRKVACDGGYRATEMEDSICDLGSWTTALPECVEKSCNKMDLQSSEWNIDVSIEEGNNEDIMHLPGTVAIVTCNEFGFLDTPTRGGRKTCSLGEWQGFELLCERVSCSKEQFSNGRFVYYDHNNQRTTNPEHGSRLEAVCESGAHFIDGEVMHTSWCWNGQWEQEVPACIGDPCLHLVNHPDNLAVTYSEESDGSHYPHSTLATFHCVEEGFVLEDVNEGQRTCRKGEWRGPSTHPRCTIAICEVRLDNGNLHYMNDTAITRPPRHGDRVTVTCNDGFTISNVVESITCVNGVWDRILPTCVEAKCLAVSSMDYFTIFYNGASSSENEFDPDTELEVTCRDGLFLDRTESSICRNGQWSPSIPRCTSVANCQPVLDEEGREIEYFEDRPYVHGSDLTVSCDNDDTVLIGSMTSTCNNGTWNPPVGKCLANVAKNKRAYQGSSTYRDSGADLAVNGLTVEIGRCSQTQTTNQWWFVDLGANFTVREINIYHNDYQNTPLDAEVRVGQEAGYKINQNTLVGRLTNVSSNPVRITVNGNVEGRFVGVDHTGSSDHLVLCEVQIFGDLLGDPCDNGCVAPRTLANGRYSVRSDNVAPGSCFRDTHLRVDCNPGNILFGGRYYTCDQTTGKLDNHNTGYMNMLSDCGSSCPRPQINPNVLYFVGENNDPIGERTAFNQAEEIYSKCEDPRYQLHVGSDRRRCQRGTWTGVWTGSAPRCDISQLHMDISPTTSLTISPSGQFVLVTPMDEVTISCRNRLNSAQLSRDTLIRKNSKDTHGERSDDTSVFRLVIINPTAEDNGIYTCLSSGLSHSISVTFEETNRCSRPYIFPKIIAHVGVGEDTTAIGNRQSFMRGETITFRCEDVRNQTLDGPIHRQCIDGQWTERAPRCETSQLKVGVDNTILKTVSPDGTFIVYPIEGMVYINCQLRRDRIGNSATITTNSTTQPSQIAYIVGKLKRLRLRNPTSGNDGTYTCQTESQRHSIRIKFQDIRCPALGNVSNGRWAYMRARGNRLDPHAYILNEKVTLQCNAGYHASSNQESRCNYQGQWSPPLSSCIA